MHNDPKHLGKKKLWGLIGEQRPDGRRQRGRSRTTWRTEARWKETARKTENNLEKIHTALLWFIDKTGSGPAEVEKLYCSHRHHRRMMMIEKSLSMDNAILHLRKSTNSIYMHNL